MARLFRYAVLAAWFTVPPQPAVKAISVSGVIQGGIAADLGNALLHVGIQAKAVPSASAASRRSVEVPATKLISRALAMIASAQQKRPLEEGRLRGGTSAYQAAVRHRPRWRCPAACSILLSSVRVAGHQGEGLSPLASMGWPERLREWPTP